MSVPGLDFCSACKGPLRPVSSALSICPLYAARPIDFREPTRLGPPRPKRERNPQRRSSDEPRLQAK